MPKRGENISKRKDGRWEARYIKGRDKTGKAKYGYVYAHSYRDVKTKRDQRLNEEPSLEKEKSGSQLFCCVLDMTIDFVLIYGKAGFPKLGANGSAYSTVAVELIALVWCIAESNKRDNIHADFKGFRWHSSAMTKDLLKIAFPMLTSSLAWGLGFSMHSFIMGHLGSNATAAASITSIAQELITCICKGISAGAGIMIGKLLGSNLLDKAREYGKKFCRISLCIGGIHMLLLALISPVVATFFVLTETAKQYLIIMLIFSAFYVFAYSVNTIIVCGVFSAGGDSKYDAVSVFFASWCFAIPLALLATFVFDLPVMVVYILMCSDEIVKLPWLYPRYKKYLWLKNLTKDESIGNV